MCILAGAIDIIIARRPVFFLDALLYRTAALMAMLAVCVAASGAAVPASAPWSAGDPVEIMEDWIAFLAEGLGLGLLATHFEGLASAACCM